MDIPAILDRYQSGLGALIGFGGVIVTLLVNARLDRRRQLQSQAHEADVVRRSLLVELTILRDNVQADVVQLTPQIERSGGATFFMNEMLFTKMYDRVLDKLGLLSGKEAEKVIIAYSSARLLPLQVLSEKASAKMRSDRFDKFGEEMILVPASISKSIVSMMESQLSLYNDAIELLSASL